MTIILQEGSLSFEFFDQWQAVCKYDNSDFYKNTIAPCQNIKAVDFIATQEDNLLWIEVKDFRGYRQENRPRLSPQEPEEVTECRQYCRNIFGEKKVKINRDKLFLGDEITEKVCHTVLGLVGAWRSQEQQLIPYIEDFGNKTLKVVLFLQQDEELDREFNLLASNLKLAITQRLNQRLNFLNVQDILVVNATTLSPNQEGWKLLTEIQNSS